MTESGFWYVNGLPHVPPRLKEERDALMKSAVGKAGVPVLINRRKGERNRIEFFFVLGIIPSKDTEDGRERVREHRKWPSHEECIFEFTEAANQDRVSFRENDTS